MKSRAGAALGTFVFFWVAPAMVAGLVPYLVTRWQIQPPLLSMPGTRVLGVGLVVSGLAVLLESFARFALVGRGTPAPVAPTASLVVSGLYRFVRNPMYLAVLAIVEGQAFLFGRWLLLAYAAGLWLLFHAFVCAYEEPALRRQFGASYEEYRTHVPRWWPRRSPWVPSPAPSADQLRGAGPPPFGPESSSA